MPRIKQWLEGVRRHLLGNGARAAKKDGPSDPPKRATTHAPRRAGNRGVEITRAVFPDKESLR
jgi:hypothetical protein